MKLIVGDEEFDDIGNGSDCGLFEIFPYLHDHITIRQVMDHEESDSAGSLVDFIEDDMNDEEGDDSDSSSSEYNSVVDVSEDSSDYDSDEKRESEVDEKRGAKKRKVVVISDSD